MWAWARQLMLEKGDFSRLLEDLKHTAQMTLTSKECCLLTWQLNVLGRFGKKKSFYFQKNTASIVSPTPNKSKLLLTHKQQNITIKPDKIVKLYPEAKSAKIYALSISDGSLTKGNLRLKECRHYQFQSCEVRKESGPSKIECKPQFHCLTCRNVPDPL